jgi:hypothetical protein
MITKYSQFKFEALLESLILESKLEFSKAFTNILSLIKGDRIAEELLKLVNNRIDDKFIQNYIDVTDKKDEVSFIPDRKAIEIIGKEEIKWKTANNVGHKYFTYNKNNEGIYKNRHLFEALGFNPEEIGEWVPVSGVSGKIIAETVSKKSGKIAVWFVSDNGEQAVINKEALIPINDSYEKLWKISRNPIKVGRLAKSLLNVVNIKTTPKEIENFVNLYKSSFDIINDAFSKFELVKGDLISYWYNHLRYESMESTLGNSCMADVDDDFFDIYVKNTEVCSLLILYSDKGNKGKIQDGTYKSDKIKGRALVWKTNEGDIFMDRIYTNNDSDVSLFKQYAERNGWWFKTKQNSDVKFSVSNGKTQKNVEYVVSLNYANFDNYPYVDSLRYININDNLISNNPSLIDANYIMNDTDGCLEEI